MINGGAKVLDSIFGLEFLAVIQFKVKMKTQNSKVKKTKQNKKLIKYVPVSANVYLWLSLNLLCFGSDTMSQSEGVSF